MLEIVAGPLDAISVQEIELSQSGSSRVAFGKTFGIGYPQAAGVLPQIKTPPTPEDPSVSTLPAFYVATKWIKQPTVPAKYLKRWNIATNLSGHGLKNIFYKGLIIPPGQSLVVWCINGSDSDLMEFYVKVEA
jgi:hypothetical protein